jgi:hypothetical protein
MASLGPYAPRDRIFLNPLEPAKPDPAPARAQAVKMGPVGLGLSAATQITAVRFQPGLRRSRRLPMDLAQRIETGWPKPGYGVRGESLRAGPARQRRAGCADYSPKRTSAAITAYGRFLASALERPPH